MYLITSLSTKACCFLYCCVLIFLHFKLKFLLVTCTQRLFFLSIFFHPTPFVMEGELLFCSCFPYHMVQAFIFILVEAFLTTCQKEHLICQIQVAQPLRLLEAKDTRLVGEATKKLSRIRAMLIYSQFCKALSCLRRDIFQSLHKGRKHTFRMKHSPFNLISDSLLLLS